MFHSERFGYHKTIFSPHNCHTKAIGKWSTIMSLVFPTFLLCVRGVFKSHKFSVKITNVYWRYMSLRWILCSYLISLDASIRVLWWLPSHFDTWGWCICQQIVRRLYLRFWKYDLALWNCQSHLFGACSTTVSGTWSAVWITDKNCMMQQRK